MSLQAATRMSRGKTAEGGSEMALAMSFVLGIEVVLLIPKFGAGNQVRRKLLRFSEYIL